MKEYTKTIENVIKDLESNYQGLSDVQVKKSRQKHGENVIKKAKGKSLLKKITDAMLDPMLIILEIAMIITLGVNIGKALKGVESDFYECIGIIFAISVSTFLTVYMEGKSQKAFDMLNKIYDTQVVKVRRNGEIKLINQKEIVVGDIILLESGDKILADGRLISSRELSVDESMLTGESKAVKKFSDVVLEDKTPLAERKNMVYSGTFVVGGSAEMLVSAVGDSAEMGIIASDIQVKNIVSAPLQEKLDRLGKFVASLGLIASAFVLILTMTQLYVNNNVSFETVEEAFLSSIVLIVASVPEGLPTTVAISLTLNVVKLFKSNALIKKLVASETVGCVSVICSDKTGTLTENKMKVVKISYYKEGSQEFIKNNICVNSSADLSYKGKTVLDIGNATECALLRFIDEKNKVYKNIRDKYKVLDRTPFSSEIKYMSTTIKQDGNLITYFKGAPEIIINNIDLTQSEKIKLENEIKFYQQDGKRVIAFSHKENEKITFDGYVLIMDAVRKDVYNSILECKKAGIAVKMLTGDNYDTAFSIAKELKIASNKSEVVNAQYLDELDDESLKNKLKHIKVVARSTPKSKLRIVKLLKELGEVVAVTGDGINDAPAIKHADIGIAMGSGSEITKEASDIVLLDNSFSTIITAISFGRNVYQNFQRFITFQLSVNLTAVMFIVVSLLLGLENPFTTLQLLWINIIMDGPPALTLSLESRGFELMNNKPVKRSNNILSKKMIAKIFIHSIVTCSLLISQYKYNFLNCNESELKTIIFTIFTLFQLFNAFNCRELGSTSIIKNLKSNKPMLYVFALTFIVQIILTQCFGTFFGTVKLPIITWIKCILLSSSIILLSEIYKILFRVFIKNKKDTLKTIKSFN